MKVAISGSHGFIGQALVIRLMLGQRLFPCEIIKLVRSRQQEGVYFNPDTMEADTDALKGIDVLIHLGGANIAAKRWTNRRKDYLLQNRQAGSALAHRVAAAVKPKTLIIASAVGYYGKNPSGECTEKSPNGDGVAAEICRAIEDHPEIPGVRRVFLRFGVVLGSMANKGGVLEKMMPAFAFGLGGPLGNGQQPFPWVDLGDAVKAIRHCISQDTLKGPVNVVAPESITQGEFAKAIGDVINRPTFLKMPALMVKLLFGEMGEELLLHGQRVQSQKLFETGFEFGEPTIRGSLISHIGTHDAAEKHAQEKLHQAHERAKTDVSAELQAREAANFRDH